MPHLGRLNNHNTAKTQTKRSRLDHKGTPCEVWLTGNYWLPTNILTACRNEIMANEKQWLSCVQSKEFLHFFDGPDCATWEESWNAEQGFGLTKLKKHPAGFPADYEHIRYLRLKDYCCWHHVSDDFFSQPDWLDRMEEIFLAAKPMMDFMNSVIDDYE